MKVETALTFSEIKVEGGTLTGKAIFNIPDYPVIPPPVAEPPVVVPPPVIEFPPGLGISSGWQGAINEAAEGKDVIWAIGDYRSVPNINLKPGVSLIGAGSKGSVVIRPAVKKGYVAGSDNSDAWLRNVSPTRVDKPNRIHNLKIIGEGAQGGIFTENINGVSLKDIEIGLCSFQGFWARNSKGLRVDGMRLYDNSWCSDGWASGEFCYVELDDFIINNVHVSSSSPSKGYGFKAIWGVISSGQYRNMYNGKFTKLRMDMHHQSNWNGGKSNNIGFEMQSVHVKGAISLEDSDVENQISLHQADAGGSTGSFKYLNNRHNGENDRYAIEYIMNNVEVAGNTITNCSQFLFNGQPNIKVKNGNIHHNNFDQGTAPDVDWGATFLFGKDGAENVNIKSNTIRRRSVTELLKFQNVQGGVNIDADNVIKTY